MRGGEKATEVPEMFVERLITSEENSSVDSHSSQSTLGNITIKEEPKRRRGDPRFQKNEKVWIKSRYGNDGIFTWLEGDPMRPANIELVAVRGKGVKQEVEYDIRFENFNCFLFLFLLAVCQVCVHIEYVSFSCFFFYCFFNKKQKLLRKIYVSCLYFISL